MHKLFRNTTVVAILLSFIGIIGASKPSESQDANPSQHVQKKKHEESGMLVSHALIQEDFSGVESEPIVKAFMSWMVETNGDIIIEPPTERDAVYFDLFMTDGNGNVNIFEMDLEEDAKKPEHWGPTCRNTFYIVRITSRHPVIKFLDKERNNEILAFTFSGCMYKFIAVVADRMRHQDLMYTTMLHELGHMWGLPDNKEGKNSIMNGSWPGASCITKRDIKELYELHGKKNSMPGTGCN
jgi:hypothetical protein